MGINAIIEQDIVSTFQKFNPETIILFGSYAHGNPDEESDIDIIVIYHTPKRFLDRLEELYLSWDIPDEESGGGPQKLDSVISSESDH
jgi:predicted nucleotidyltransferase